MTWILLIATVTLLASLSVSVHRAQTEAADRLCDCPTHPSLLAGGHPRAPRLLTEALPASVVPFPTGRIPTRPRAALPRPGRRTIPVRHRPLRPADTTPSGLRPAG